MKSTYQLGYDRGAAEARGPWFFLGVGTGVGISVIVGWFL